MHLKITACGMAGMESSSDSEDVVTFGESVDGSTELLVELECRLSGVEALESKSSSQTHFHKTKTRSPSYRL